MPRGLQTGSAHTGGSFHDMSVDEDTLEAPILLLTLEKGGQCVLDFCHSISKVRWHALWSSAFHWCWIFWILCATDLAAFRGFQQHSSVRKTDILTYWLITSAEEWAHAQKWKIIYYKHYACWVVGKSIWHMLIKNPAIDASLYLLWIFCEIMRSKWACF